LLGVLKGKKESPQRGDSFAVRVEMGPILLRGVRGEQRSAAGVPKASGLTAETWDVGTQVNDTLGTGSMARGAPPIGFVKTRGGSETH